MKDGLDLVTADFVYVRWLGDRKGIEALTTTWDKTVIERTDDLRNWAALFRQFVSRNLKVYAYANNHYAGHGPGRSSCFGICGRRSKLVIDSLFRCLVITSVL